MRKLILQMQVSVDGYVGRKSGGPDWQLWDWGDNSLWDDALFADFNAFFAAADTILLGRNTAEGYINHWIEFAEKHPRKPQFAFARRVNEARKVVFSRTLKKSRWPSAEVAAKPLVEEIDNLKAQAGKSIITFGGAGFAAELINANLVDEYQFYTNPIALHEGLSIFEKRGIDSDLQLISARAYECGIVVSKYAPRGRA